MESKKLTGEQIEKMDNLLNYVANEVDDIQRAGVEVYIDFDAILSALCEMREIAGLPKWG